ncbi:MAG: hypothetical protein E7185_03855 [Erysipelotrichaceae bacterium]|nr:hypothetical protein [Erysipelotrichaceae bacterium]
MIRIAICCGGGFSSSALAAHLEREVAEQNLQDKVKFVFIPIHQLANRQDEADIAMACPHTEYKVKQDSAAGRYHIPVTIIPPRLYGLMPVRDFVEDAEDLLELWNQGGTNMMTFPDEPRPLAVKRMVSHRRWLKGETADFNKKHPL